MIHVADSHGLPEPLSSPLLEPEGNKNTYHESDHGRPKVAQLSTSVRQTKITLHFKPLREGSKHYARHPQRRYSFSFSFSTGCALQSAL